MVPSSLTLGSLAMEVPFLASLLHQIDTLPRVRATFVGGKLVGKQNLSNDSSDNRANAFLVFWSKIKSLDLFLS